MKVNVVRDDKLSKEYQLSISADDIKKHMNTLIAEESPNIALAGFRKGKVPLAMIKSHYGDKFEQKARMSVLEESIENLAKEHGLTREDLNITSHKMEGTNIDLTLTYDTMEPFELTELSTLKLDNYSLDENDAELQKLVYQRHFMNARTDFENPTEDAISEDCAVEAVVSVYFDEKQKMEVFANKTVLIYTSHDAYLGKDFVKKLIGMKAGDNVSFEVTFPKTQPSKELAGKKHKVEVNISKVWPMKGMTDAEFIEEQRNVLKAENDDDAKKKMLQRYARSFAADYIDPIHKRKVLDALDGAYKFDVSPRLLEKEREQIQKRFTQEKEQATQNGIILEEEMTKTPAEIEKELDKLALRRIKISNIFKKLSVKYATELQITEWDLQMQVFEYAHARGLDFNAVAELLGKNEEFKRTMINVARENKILNFVHKSATLTEKVEKEEIEILKVFNEILPGVLLTY